MKNYREQDGCHNCQRVFVKSDHDELPEFYCTLNAPQRPLCLSVEMGESPEVDYSLPKEDRIAIEEKLIDDWNFWREGREVKVYGICDAYERG